MAIKKVKNNRKEERIMKTPEERKQEIIENALKLFSEYGYENTTILDIANATGVSQGLCYRYFKSKAEIFEATSDYYASQAVKHFTIPLSKEQPAIEKFNLVIRSIFEYTITNHEYEAKYGADSEDTEIRASRVDNVASQIVEIIIPIIKQGVDEGIFECSDIVNTTKILTYGIIHTIHSGMPEKNVQKYFLTILSSCKDIFIKTLKISEPEKLGKGWDNICISECTTD